MTFYFHRRDQIFIAECDALLPPERLGGPSRRCERMAVIAAPRQDAEKIKRDLARADEFYFRRSAGVTLVMCGPCRADRRRAIEAEKARRRAGEAAARKRASRRAARFRQTPPPAI